MNKRIHMIWFVMLGFYFSCSAPGTTPQKSAAYSVDYQEDLSVHRKGLETETFPEAGRETNPASPTAGIPEQAARADNDISDELESLTASVAEKNKRLKSIPGFTILVYTGNSREMANQAKRQVYYVIPEAQPQLKYQQPNYKVQVGQFTERLEAQKSYAMLKKEFPNALIIPDRIQIK